MALKYAEMGRLTLSRCLRTMHHSVRGWFILLPVTVRVVFFFAAERKSSLQAVCIRVRLRGASSGLYEVLLPRLVF